MMPEGLLPGPEPASQTMSTTPQEHATRYDNPTIIMHWLSAFLIVFQFVLGETWHWPPRPVHHLMVVAHLTIGVILTVLIPFRLWWRLTQGRHFTAQLAPLDRFFTVAMESTLYGLIGVEIVLGYAWRWGAGQAISFFGLLIHAPFAPLPHETVLFFKTLHSWTAWLIIGLACGHALAALVHQHVLKDSVLARMLPRRTPTTAP
ncbi:cytochrome b [Acetobacter peroxydans]|uniref:Cytochrome b n=1 Tax=Acetobacter peroxydans TaxID=104098 RepID=A0A4Y3TXF8_9PROT|nr:cytochrome b/b6 domain-containing protein [Acetobacter peroxydans]GEB86483.1 cytochrome b [Acetobacter peroxydans]